MSVEASRSGSKMMVDELAKDRLSPRKAKRNEDLLPLLPVRVRKGVEEEEEEEESGKRKEEGEGEEAEGEGEGEGEEQDEEEILPASRPAVSLSAFLCRTCQAPRRG